jgi:hypothetical protein
VHSRAFGGLHDGVPGLALRADEQDILALGDDIRDEFPCAEYALDGLANVSDMNLVARPENIRAHLGIPGTGPMTEMNP